MVSTRDLAFGQFIVGIAFMFVPILIIHSFSPDRTFSKDLLLAFNVFGLTAGFLSASLILNSYYKLTERFKEW